MYNDIIVGFVVFLVTVIVHSVWTNKELCEVKIKYIKTIDGRKYVKKNN